jgi:hypothetical protein
MNNVVKPGLILLGGLLLSLCILLYPHNVKASRLEEEKPVKERKFKERIFFGGGLGLQFGTITAINVSPLVGYRITEKLSTGISGTYQYYHNRQFNMSTDIYGGGLFTRYLITRMLFVHAEYEVLSLRSANFLMANESGKRFVEQNYFAGGGVRLHLGGRTYLNLMLLYNFNENSYVHFQNPMFRFGIDVGF